MILKYIITILIGYFLGNVSFARLISRGLKADITKQGSGNPGSMNMLRTFGFKVGVLNLFLDALKAVAAALIGMLVFWADPIKGVYLGGLGAVLGHNFPIAYRFKGGKGVACIVGLYFVANPLWSLVAFAISFVYLYFFDYGAVASFIFLAALTIIEGVKHSASPDILIIILLLFFLTLFMHRKNIERLCLGKERKANFAKNFKCKNKQKK